MSPTEKIAAIQGVLGVKVDGIWGPKTQAALDSLINPGAGILHVGKASSFADPRDVERFRKCKAQGKSDQECFEIGDNGIGCWGDDVTGATPACALPPDDMIERWGSVEAARHKPVEVRIEDKSVICVLKDRMPWKKDVINHAIIDLNPGACAALGLEPPIMVSATWKWAS